MLGAPDRILQLCFNSLFQSSILTKKGRNITPLGLQSYSIPDSTGVELLEKSTCWWNKPLPNNEAMYTYVVFPTSASWSAFPNGHYYDQMNKVDYDGNKMEGLDSRNALRRIPIMEALNR